MDNYKKVIVGVNESENSHRAFNKAVSIAKNHSATLYVVSAVQYIASQNIINSSAQMNMPTLLNDSADLMERLLEMRRKYVGDLVDKAKEKGVKCVEAVVEIENEKTFLVSLFDDYKNSLIVVGVCEEHQFKRLILGSTASFTVNHAPCNVLVVKNNE